MIWVEPSGSSHNRAVYRHIDLLDIGESRNVEGAATFRVGIDHAGQRRCAVVKDLTCVARPYETQTGDEQPRRSVRFH